jgi:1,2-diacylglycerol 3-alpha-glucosyltransferase
MKIALFSDTYPPEINGVSVSVDLHHRVLKQQGHDVMVITTNSFGNTIDIQNGMVRIPGLELKKLYGYRMSSFFNGKAYRLIRKWQPEVVHIHTDAGIGIFGKITAFFLKVPTVVTYHTMYEDYTHYAGFLKGVANRVVKQFSKSIAQQCTEFISPSHKTKDRIRSYGVDRYINIVPTGIDFSRFQIGNLNQEILSQLKTKWIQPGERVLLSLGRVAKEKSIDVVLNGFAAYLKIAQQPTRLIIVGDGPDRPTLIRYAQQLGIENNVSFVGAVPIVDVPYYYQLADLFVSASITETQGLTFMEAMVSGKMVLCRYDENLAGLIRHQETGFIYETPSEFAQQVKTILSFDDDRIKKMKLAIKEAVNQYALPTFYENLIEVYNRAIRQYW